MGQTRVVLGVGLLSVLALLWACVPQGGPSGAKEITSFIFSAADNPVLSADATGEISGTAIVVRVPFDASVTSLIPRFATTGASVWVAGTQQVTGQTAHDFTSTVLYMVVAEDGTSSTYGVTVGRQFTDAFDRADSPTVGNGWLKLERGSAPQSAASISGNALLLQGGWDGATAYAPDVYRSLALSGTFTLTVRFEADTPSSNRFLVRLSTSDPTKGYFLGFLEGNLEIVMDTGTTLESVSAGISAGAWHTLTVSRSSSALSVVLKEEGTAQQWSTSTTDSTYQSFATVLLRGGWYTTAVLSVTADDLAILTP